MTQTIVNLGSAGSVLNGQNGSSSAIDSNDALKLDWPGSNGGNYLYLPGVASNTARVPDAAALDITGDIDIRLHVALDEWASGATAALFDKWTATGNQRSWNFGLTSANALLFAFTADGSTGGANYNSTVAPTVADDEPLWIRVTRTPNNGSGVSEVKFYTSDDGSTWTQLGATVTSANTALIYSGTSDVGTSGFNLRAFKLYRAQVLNGIGGTTVLDIDTSVITSGAATSFTAVTGQTVTINRSTSGRKSVAVVSPVWLFGTDDYMEVPHNALVDFGGDDSFTVFLAARTWSTPTSYMRYLEKGAALGTGYSIQSHATALGFFFGVRSNSTWYLQDGFTYSSGSFQTIAMRIDHSANLMTNYRNASPATAVAIPASWPLNNAEPLRIGSRSGAAGQYGEFELLAVAIFRRALTATEISTLNTYYQARLS